ncbi:metal ABC transporter substrate-binding protein [uncultured Ruminococcus sp.]|uniref:metal ABC transporter substrate-binding protein n=1 Tax=uncultured Ruminococcus sp. TaxID=165186 RepID=UPI0026122D8D|nr:metal ABC transporter substrate-binding protein [uncultured Ruminococcus sp.]
MRKRLICAFTALAVFTVAMLCGCVLEPVDRKGRLSVVTTSFPPYDFTRAVTGESADITMLLQAGAEAHSYEPVPLDIAKIQNCDVFVYIGGEGEVWVDRILDSIDTSDMTIIRLFDFVDPLVEESVDGASPNGHFHSHGEKCSCDEEGGEYDEHIWTSPRNAKRCVEGIEAALCGRYPESTAAYSENAAGYTEKLDELDREFEDMSKNAPNHTIVVGDRFPFRYLAHDYGLSYYAAFSGCSSESEPSVYTMAYLIDKLLEDDNKAVFYLEFSTKKLAEKLSDATGAEMLRLHSCHNVSKSDFRSGVTYIDLMKDNFLNIQEALY